MTNDTPQNGYGMQNPSQHNNGGVDGKQPVWQPPAYTQNPQGYPQSGNAQYRVVQQVPNQGAQYAQQPQRQQVYQQYAQQPAQQQMHAQPVPSPVQAQQAPTYAAYNQAAMPQQAPQTQSGNQEPKPPKKKKSASFYVAIVIAVIAIAAACIFAYTWWDSQNTSNRDSNALIGQIEGKSPEEIEAELDRIVEEGMFNISICSEVVFNDGNSEGNFQIENVPGNRYLMQVDITRDDTGQLIYESGVIEPNYHIQTAKLDTPLPKGTYVCTATFSALDPETESLIGTAAAKINITVLN